MHQLKVLGSIICRTHEPKLVIDIEYMGWEDCEVYRKICIVLLFNRLLDIESRLIRRIIVQGKEISR